MENVSDRILAGIPDTLNNNIRDSIIYKRIKLVEKEFAASAHLDASIKPYFYGNQYWISLSETYRDIRLVGFPPNGIGSFGGDVENWAWPRHTGDFSLFRIYADKDNKPTDFNTTNLPYNNKQFFVINATGFKEGNFTMVYGFPGTTQEYISSYELKHIAQIADPIRIRARTSKLNTWDKYMNSNREIFLKYTSKRASIANGWKKWQGELKGLKQNNVMDLKKDYENYFNKKAINNASIPYAATLLDQIKLCTQKVDSLVLAEEYIRECVTGVELIQQAAISEKLLPCFRLGLSTQALRDTLIKIAKSAQYFYKNYDAQADKDIFQNLIPMYMHNAGSMVPAYFTKQLQEHQNNYYVWGIDVYKSSVFADSSKFFSFIQDATAKDSTQITADGAYGIYKAVNEMRAAKTQSLLTDYYKNINYLNRLYMHSRMIINPNRNFYPDANLTLRLTYGTVKGMDPDGPEPYSFQTTLNDVIAADNPNVDIFKVPAKLKELYKQKDFGQWQVNGTVPVAFIAANHTSGGNSGSPVLNSKGELIGTNFDRPWEGTMSDLYYDSSVCRNITLDVRYTLFIIEKFGDAGWLLNEMKIIK
jgi:Peptidase S46